MAAFANRLCKQSGSVWTGCGGNSLTLFVLLLGFNGWEAVTRIARGLAISAGEQGYATAARDIGASPFRVYFGHILPNIAATIMVAMMLWTIWSPRDPPATPNRSTGQLRGGRSKNR